MFGLDGLQVNRICNQRLVFKKEIEAQWNYNKSYSLSFKNIANGNSTGSNWIEKNGFV